MKQICEMCGRTIEKPEISFRIKIEMFADPSPPEFTEEDLERDFAAEMAELIEQMRRADIREAEDEVYESYLFTLCADCRKKVHDYLRRQHLPFEDM